MTEPAAVEDDVVDDARFGAAGTRKTARWIASGLGGIPSLAVVAAIVREPGEQGFDGTLLGLGIAFATIGALIGMWAFARVLAPIPLSDADMGNFNLGRIPESSVERFDELRARLQEERSAIADKELDVVRSESMAGAAEAEATRSEAAADAAADDDDDSAEGKKHLAALRRAAVAARARAVERREVAAGDASELVDHRQQLERLQDVRKTAYKLEAAERVANRYSTALWAGLPTALFLAMGLGLLGMAPNPNEDAVPLTLVEVTLNEQGQDKLGCNETKLSAIRTGGEDRAPVLITLPSDGCAPKAVTFPVESPSPLGSVETVEEIDGG